MATIPQFFSGPMTVIEYEHDKTHEGRFFSGGYYNSSLADATNQDFLVTTSADNTFHAQFLVAISGDCTMQIFEGPTTSGGTSVSMSNHNRSSSKVCDLTVKHTPTVTGTGTQINGTIFLPGGDKHTGGGGHFGFANEFMLAKSTSYLLRVTNVSGGAIKISVGLFGYHPNI